MNILKVILQVMLILISSLGYTQELVSGGPENDIIGRFCLHSDHWVACIERNPDWGSGDLYTTIRTNSGWSELYPVVIKTGNQSTHSIITSADDSLHIYYASDETGTYKIYEVKSTDAIHWSEGRRIHLGWAEGVDVYDPHAIVLQDGTLAMTYIKLGGGAFVSMSNDGYQWDEQKLLIQTGAYRCRIAEGSTGNFMASYHRNIGNNQYDVHIKKSENLTDWSEEVRVTNHGNCHDPCCVQQDNGKWLVFFAQYDAPAYNICYLESDDGVIWSGHHQLTFDQTYNTQPAVIKSGSEMHLMWTHAIDYNTNNDIYFSSLELTQMAEQQKETVFFTEVSSGVVKINFINEKNKGIIRLYDLSGQLIAEKSVHNDVVKFTSLSPGVKIINWYPYQKSMKILIP